MAANRVRVNLNHPKAMAYIRERGRASVLRAAQTTQRRARANLARSGRINTGALTQSIDIRVTGPMRYSIGSDLPYAIYQEKGIGPVYPVRAKALRFKPKGSNVFVFAQRTRGFEGAHYMRKAYRSLTVADFM